MWTQHFIKYASDKTLFTLYANLADNRTLCANWAEPGVHNEYSVAERGRDAPLAVDWTAELHHQPGRLEAYNFDGSMMVKMRVPPCSDPAVCW